MTKKKVPAKRSKKEAPLYLVLLQGCNHSRKNPPSQSGGVHFEPSGCAKCVVFEIHMHHGSQLAPYQLTLQATRNALIST